MILLVIASFLLNQVLENPVVDGSPWLRSQMNTQKRIVGGKITQIYMHPWVASIYTNDSFICGGSIISKSVILTTFHCTTDPLESLSVRVGSSTVGFGGWNHNVSAIKRHENYPVCDGHSEKDVALMRVSPPFVFGGKVTNIKLSGKGQAFASGTVASVAGWGHTAEKGNTSSMLRSTDLLIADSEECARDYGYPSGTWMSSHGQICASAPGADVCHGDSGGPLVVGGVQVGITSWGWGCARPEYPSVYADVGFHRGWIDVNLKLLDPRKTA